MATSGAPRARALTTLHHAFRGAGRHWRWMLLAWLASWLPAWLAARPVRRLFDAALGRHPEAGRILSEFDVAALHDALSGAGDVATGIPAGFALAGLVAFLLSPWVNGMLVAALREARPLGFREAWSGGWREYGRMFRLSVLSLLPYAVAALVATGAFQWATHAGTSTLLEAELARREAWAGLAGAIAFLLAFASIEAARVAFVMDTRLHSAWRAWRRGSRHLIRRLPAWLLVVVATLAAGVLLTAALNWIGIGARHDLLVLACAQLAVLGVAWTRATRLAALVALAGPPVSS